MLKIVRLEETSQIAEVTASKQINWDNLNNIRNETNRHFRSKEMEYLKDKRNELAIISKNNNIRDLCIEQ
jgi:hypothetical protein